jgi:hypothetical protein
VFTLRPPSWLTFKFVVLQIILLFVPVFLFLAPSAPPVYAATPPASYGTAPHTLTTTLKIGITNTSGSFLDPLTPIDLVYKTYTWTVPLSNTTGGNANLYGWIDFAGSGNFTGTVPASVTVPNNSVLVTLTWQIPVTASTNITTYVRLRLATTPTLNPAGAGGAGEAEDYAVRILQSAKCDPGTKFYYVQGTVSGGSGTAIIKTYDVSTGVSATVFTPPTRTVGTRQIQNVNGLASDASRQNLYFQDSSDTAGYAVGIYGYRVISTTFFTITTNAGNAPLNITSVNTYGWTTAAGAYGNGKYYAGTDGNDLGNIYEISLNSAGTSPVQAARLLFQPNPGCTSTCRNYGDLMVFGNRMYVALWGNSPSEQQMFETWDINSGIRISNQTIITTGFAFQLARDGNNNVYALTSNNGRIYNVDIPNGTITWGTGASPIRTVGYVIHDAGECEMTRQSTAVTLSSFSADSQSSNLVDQLLPFGSFAGIALCVSGGWVFLRRKRVLADN